MKLIDAIKEHGHPFMVPDCSRDNLVELFKELGFKIGLEVGVWEGEFTEKFCVAGFKMYGVDHWLPRGRDTYFQQEARYGRALVRLSPFKCALIRKTSMEAVKGFEDGSLDFVYIDGMHKYSFVYEDIVEWSKKVRIGGAVSGHDYMCTDPGIIDSIPLKYQLHLEVKAAVDRYIEENKIEDFYVFGRSKPLEEETKNDTMLSWLFIKKV